MVSAGTQLGAMLHKNIKLKQRAVCGTLCEFGCPMVTTILAVVFIQLLMARMQTQNDTVLSYPTSSLGVQLVDLDPNCLYNGTCLLAFYPDTPFTQEQLWPALMEQLPPQAAMMLLAITPRFYNTTAALNEACQDARDHKALIVGVQVDSADLQIGHIAYNLIYDNLRLPADPRPASPFSPSLPLLFNASIYMERGFAMISAALDAAFTKLSNKEQPPATTTDEETVGEVIMKIMTKLLPTHASPNLLGFIVPVIAATMQSYCAIPFLALSIIHLVSEKVTKTREYMMILGLKKWVYWFSWFLTFLVQALFTISVMLIAYGSMGNFNGSNLFMVIAIYITYFTSLITFAFLLQAFVSSQVVALICTFAWLFLPGQIFYFLPATRDTYLLLSFIAPIDFQFAAYKMSSIAFMDDPSTSISVLMSYGEVLGMLVLDTLIYGVLAWYFIEVSPAGDYGVSRPVWFPFQKSYWFPNKHTSSSPSSSPSPVATTYDHHFEKYEQGPRDTGVRINNLTKVFKKLGSSVTAVDSLSCSFERGQITSLLGQNGAGKTTTISMLVGLLEPTNGDALVDGRSIVSDMTTIRESIGICPQFDLLFPTLTAMEHLELIGRLRGVPPKEATRMAHKALDDIALKERDYKGKQVQAFSGGMKRKLSLAMALFGDPSVVLLDEPSSGVDTVSRRAIWESLKKAAVGKTMVLTTHSMEEADALSDRILIMAHGRLKCSGTTMFLKQKFGSGYNLHISSTTTNILNTDAILSTLTSFIPATVVSKSTHHSATFKLPFGTSHLYPAMLQALEQNKEQMGINTMGISLTTLEDVFIKINTDQTVKTTDTPSTTPSQSPAPSFPSTSSQVSVVNNQHEQEEDAAEDAALIESGDQTHFERSKFYTQLWILMKAKLMFFLRSWKTSVVMTLIPTIILLLFLVPTKFTTTYVIPTASTVPKQLAMVNQQPLEVPYFVSSTVNNTLMVTVLLNSINSVVGGTLVPVQFDSLDAIDNHTFIHGGYKVGLEITELTWTAETKSLSVVLLYNTSFSTCGIEWQNTVNTAFYRMTTGNQNATISLGVQALDKKADHLTMKSNPPAIYAMLSLLVGFLISGAFSAQRMVSERETMLKSQMYLWGIHPLIYVITSLVTSLISMIAPVSLAIAVVIAFGVEGMSGAMFWPFLLVCVLFMFALVAFNLVVSNIFNKADSCIKWVFLLEFGVAILPYAVKLLWSVSTDTSEMRTNVSKAIIYSSNILPMCGMINGLMGITSPVPSSGSAAFVWEYFNATLLTLSCDFVLYTLIACGWELLKMQSWHTAIVPKPTDLVETDSDVIEERRRVESGDADQDQVICKNLHKQYSKGGKVAVHNLSMAIKREEAFGLLGPNGAGKSSTIQMMSAEIPITTGAVTVNQCPLEGPKNKYFRTAKISRCMQSDAVFDYLTGRENLEFFCRARIHAASKTVHKFVEKMIDDCSLVEFANRNAETYSGGNRRKLSVAISLLPGASTVILDEPSTGMDPMTRRALWTAIYRQRNEGRAVLLTTHSMEEAESICSTIGIIAAGKLQCIGDVQHLKSKFADGYNLTLEVADDGDGVASSWDACDQLVVNITKQPRVTVVDSAVAQRRTYQLPSVELLSVVFAQLEEAKAHGVITQYTLNQASLEDVFLRMCRMAEQQQQDPDQ